MNFDRIGFHKKKVKQSDSSPSKYTKSSLNFLILLAFFSVFSWYQSCEVALWILDKIPHHLPLPPLTIPPSKTPSLPSLTLKTKLLLFVAVIYGSPCNLWYKAMPWVMVQRRNSIHIWRMDDPRSTSAGCLCNTIPNDVALQTLWCSTSQELWTATKNIFGAQIKVFLRVCCREQEKVILQPIATWDMIKKKYGFSSKFTQPILLLHKQFRSKLVSRQWIQQLH